MKIKELYDKDITRRINPAVVVSEMDEYSIKQEIKEYVFTPSLTRYVYKFLDVIVNKKEGKTGVWINGYYGSGKSHFIKYLFYCLNPSFREDAYTNFYSSIDQLDALDEITESKANQINKALSNYEFCEVIFNIDAVTKKDDARNRITRVLLNQLNKIKGYNSVNIGIALYLEKVLDEQGLLQTFKDKVQAKLKAEWKDMKITTFVNSHLSTVLDIAKETYSDIDIDSLRRAITNRDLDFTIDYLISEIQEHLATQTENYKLVFLMDEMSQYIGKNTDLLLNLQTIVEEIGSKIGNKVWIVCTAQQDLSNLITNTDKQGEDFGKIMGRFETMISLESQDAAYITKRRVLDKNSTGTKELQTFFDQQKGDIENQFVFDHDLYANYADRDDFILTYPFVPYQFQLISDVFQSFSNIGYVGEGVKNTERAILGITHFTADLSKDEELGYFVSFDQFFNEQLDKNLHHTARNILQRPLGIKEVKEDPFALRVVKALFMISSLSDHLKSNLQANVENLSVLLLNNVTQSKKDIRDKVLKVLNILVEKNIVQESAGRYRFLKEDEIEIENEIKNTTLNLEEKYTYFYESIIRKVAPPILNIPFETNNFKLGYSVDNKDFITNADIKVKYIVFESRTLTELAPSVPSDQLTIPVHTWFAQNEELRKKFDEYGKVLKYVSNNGNTQNESKRLILSKRSDKNNVLLREILDVVKKQFLTTSIISKNHIVDASDLGGNSPETRFKAMVEHHLKEVYKKLVLSNGYATSNDELKRNARDPQLPGLTELDPAELELDVKINLLGTECNVGDLVKKMKEPPYGWKDIATLDILLQIARKGKRRFEWKHESISLEEYANYGLNSRDRDSLTIHSVREHSQEEVNAFKNGVNGLFTERTVILNEVQDYKEAVTVFRAHLKGIMTPINKLYEEHETYSFAKGIKVYHSALSELHLTRSDEELVKLFHEKESALVKQRDSYKMAEEFILSNISEFDKIELFVNNNSANFEALGEVLQVQAEELVDFVKNSNAPWESFPAMKKSYKEINDALKHQLKEKREAVAQLYTEVLDAIDAEKERLEIDEANLTPDRQTMLDKVVKEKKLDQLEIMELKASDVRKESFKTLAEFKARKKAEEEGKKYTASVPVSLAAEMAPTEIKTPEELDQYLTELRKRLMIKLANNQKIFLN